MRIILRHKLNFTRIILRHKLNFTRIILRHKLIVFLLGMLGRKEGKQNVYLSTVICMPFISFSLFQEVDTFIFLYRIMQIYSFSG